MKSDLLNMVNLRKTLLGFLCVGIAAVADAQHTDFLTDSTVVTIDFPVGKSVIQPDFCNNATRLDQITSTLHHLQNNPELQIVGVTFRGNASPEGSAQINRKLSQARLNALKSYTLSHIAIPDSIITEIDGYIAWDQVINLLEHSNYNFKDKALDIIRGNYSSVRINARDYDSRVNALRQLNGGTAWPTIYRDIFGKVRNASAIIITSQPVQQPAAAAEPELPIEQPVIEPESATADTIDCIEFTSAALPYSPCDQKHLYLKSNAIGWALLNANIGVELKTACHWSVALHGYYSALNYFTRTVKFRTAAIQPAVRYWFAGAPQQGWFVGAHLGLVWWNIAVGGNYRYQDHNGNTPTYGGGLHLGYRKQIGSHWHLEAEIGAGVYNARYDKFINESNGPLVESNIQRTWIGLDNLAINFAYSFDLNNTKSK